MPHPETPTIDDWVNCLAEIVKEPDQDTLLIGHSIGCQTILRYVAGLPESVQLQQIIFVAGWFSLQNLAKEELSTAQPWLATPIDFSQVLGHCRNIIAILSIDDPVVPYAKNKEVFLNHLHAKVLSTSGGHLGGDDKVTELPLLREVI